MWANALVTLGVAVTAATQKWTWLSVCAGLATLWLFLWGLYAFACSLDSLPVAHWWYGTIRQRQASEEVEWFDERDDGIRNAYISCRLVTCGNRNRHISHTSFWSKDLADIQVSGSDDRITLSEIKGNSDKAQVRARGALVRIVDWEYDTCSLLIDEGDSLGAELDFKIRLIRRAPRL